MNKINNIDHLYSLLPNTKTESWKYTNIKRFLPENLKINSNQIDVDLNSKEVLGGIISIKSPYKIWFKNGEFDKASSRVPSGMFIKKINSNSLGGHGFYTDPKGKSFCEKMEESSLFKKNEQRDNLLKINSLYGHTCFLIEFATNFSCEQHIEINNLFYNQAPGIKQHRLLCLINPGANVKIMEQTIDLSGDSNSHNTVCEIICLKKSFLEHISIQKGVQNNCSVKTSFIAQSKDSQSNFYNISLNGKMTRNNYHVNLCEELSSTKLYGLSCVKGKDHIDNFINVMHSAANCTSSQLFKNIYDESASGVFVGGIFVDKDSQKTEAFQQNNNILLSEKSQVNAVPQLEIFADDVVCSHGCTIGQPDFDAIFYLQSRGIKKEDAKALLNFAFLNDTFKNVSSKEIENIIRKLVLKQLNLKHYS